MTSIAEELPEEAQYVVPMAYNMHWYFHVNLRSLQWLCELRSSPAGHPNYRFIAQEMAKQVSKVCPSFERFFKFVDYEGYELGRLRPRDPHRRKTVGKGSIIKAGNEPTQRKHDWRDAAHRRKLHWRRNARFADHHRYFRFFPFFSHVFLRLALYDGHCFASR